MTDDVKEEAKVRALANGHAIARPWQWLDIIDQALADPDLIERYQAAMKPGSVLRRTSTAASSGNATQDHPDSGESAIWGRRGAVLKAHHWIASVSPLAYTIAAWRASGSGRRR